MHRILKNTKSSKSSKHSGVSGWPLDIKGVNCEFFALPTSGADFQSALKGLENALSSNADVESAAQAVRAAVEARQKKGKQNRIQRFVVGCFCLLTFTLMSMHRCNLERLRTSSPSPAPFCLRFREVYQDSVSMTFPVSNMQSHLLQISCFKLAASKI